MTMQKANNGNPYPDANSKLMDTWSAIRDLAMATAPAAYMIASRASAQNAAGGSWTKLALDTINDPDDSGSFATALSGGFVLPKFTGWCEGYGTYRLVQGSYPNGRRQIGLGDTSIGAPFATTTISGVTGDNGPLDLSFTGIFPVTNNVPITVWAYQDSDSPVPLLVANRLFYARRLS